MSIKGTTYSFSKNHASDFLNENAICTVLFLHIKLIFTFEMEK